MIYVKNTPNNTGVAIYGDLVDYDHLYNALHEIVGDEDEFNNFDAARLRVLGVCYDLRHALMGDREIEFVDNGMDDEKKRRMSVLSSEKNVYYKINVLWPEMLFVTMALNDFIRLYAQKRAKNSYNFMFDKQNIWDHTIATVRFFQASIAKCIEETVEGTAFSRIMNLMVKEYTWVGGYTWQYLDVLNVRFMEMDADKRIKNLSIMAKRLAEQGKEYLELRKEIAVAARKYDTFADNIDISLEYPDDIVW